MAVEYDLKLATDPDSLEAGDMPKLDKTLRGSQYDALYKMFKELPRIMFEDYMKSIMKVPYVKKMPGKICRNPLVHKEGEGMVMRADGSDDRVCPINQEYLGSIEYDHLMYGENIVHYVGFYRIFKKANTDAMIEFGFTSSEEWENEKMRRHYIREAEKELLKGGF